MLGEVYIHGAFIRQKTIQPANVHAIILILFLYLAKAYILSKICSGVDVI